jgi:hypothetical protein
VLDGEPLVVNDDQEALCSLDGHYLIPYFRFEAM